MAWKHPWLPYFIIAAVFKSYFRAVPQAIYLSKDTLIFEILFYHIHTVAASLKLLSASLLWDPGLHQCIMIPFNTRFGINPFPSYLIKDWMISLSTRAEVILVRFTFNHTFSIKVAIHTYFKKYHTSSAFNNISMLLFCLYSPLFLKGHHVTKSNWSNGLSRVALFST